MKRTQLELDLFEMMLEGKQLPFLPALRLAGNSFFDPLRMILIYMPGPIGYKLRQLYYGSKCKSLGKNALIDVGVIISGPENISIGEYTWIDSFVRLEGVLGEIKIGRRVHIASGSILSGGGGLEVQDYVGIGAGAKIYTNSEAPVNGKRMSGPMIPWRYKGFVRKPVIIEKDAVVGANSVVLPGVRIGEGAVVGANSLVTRDIPAWSIAIGVPARIAGQRDKVTVPDI